MTIELNEKERQTVLEALKAWMDPIGYLSSNRPARKIPDVTDREAKGLIRKFLKRA